MQTPFPVFSSLAASDVAVAMEPASGRISGTAAARDSAALHAAWQFEKAQASRPAVGGATPPDRSSPAMDAISSVPPGGAPFIGDDPLYRYQWHLKNTGQRVFADGLPKPGIDLNIGTLHDDGVTGKGVVVGLSEFGRPDATHEDLAANMARPGTGDNVSAHATMTAGLIAAVGWNGIGARGVAPQARILDMTDVDDENAEVIPRVINTSTGFAERTLEPYRSDHDPVEWTRRWTTYNGPVLIKSAGNDFLSDPDIGATEQVCQAATLDSGSGCVSPQTDRQNGNPNTVTVAAVNAMGVKASYSSVGSVIWVSGLGGETGLERASSPDGVTQVPVGSVPGFAFEPALVSLDVSGCGNGIDQMLPANTWPNRLDRPGGSPLNPDCSYTALANGTSAAAPTVAGVVALMLQVNPDLTWRDIKYILAVTARKIDPGLAPRQHNGVRVDDGWVVNAAGRPFSNWYGFGLVDATRAVERARNFTTLPALRSTGQLASRSEPIPITYGKESGGYAEIDVPVDMRTEMAYVRLRTTHKEPQYLRIALTSPSGTRSIVLPPLTYLRSEGGGDFTTDALLSNAFLDENAKGKWKLQVVDVREPCADKAALLSWELQVLGH